MIRSKRVVPAKLGDDQMRSRDFRRHQTTRHMWRRLKEDRNQHYNDLTCPCWSDKKSMARFKEQPKLQQCYCCCNPRRNPWLTKVECRSMQERRADWVS